MAQPEKRENSVLFSLRELRQIEENRVQEEESAVRTAEDDRVRAVEAATQVREAAETARIREERGAALAIETARENAEREARMRVESVEASERQRQQAALEQQRLQQEMELRRAEVAKKRPTWMLAVTGIAMVGVIIAIVLVVKFSGQSDDDREKAVQAEKDKQVAEKTAADAVEKVERLQRDLEDLDTKVGTAVDSVMAAQSDADRSTAKAKLLALRTEKAAMEQRIADAKNAAALARRKQGATVSKECQNNPLAKGCM